MKVKDLCLMTVCLCILILCSKIIVPIGVISITLQTFAVAIIPYILKWKRASIVLTAYILMGLLGIPVFSDGGGFLYVLKPSFGFILGFLVSTFITGSNVFKNSKIAGLIKGLFGLLVLDFIGIVYMYFILKYYIGSDKASIVYVIQVGFLPFILKDSISVVFAYLISLRLSPILDNMQLSSKEYIEKETKM